MTLRLRKLSSVDEIDNYLEFVFNRSISNKKYQDQDNERNYPVLILQLSYLICLICLCFPPSMLMFLFFNDLNATKAWFRSLDFLELLAFSTSCYAFLNAIFKVIQSILDKLLENYYRNNSILLAQ